MASICQINRGVSPDRDFSASVFAANMLNAAHHLVEGRDNPNPLHQTSKVTHEHMVVRRPCPCRSACNVPSQAMYDHRNADLLGCYLYDMSIGMSLGIRDFPRHYRQLSPVGENFSSAGVSLGCSESPHSHISASQHPGVHNELHIQHEVEQQGCTYMIAMISYNVDNDLFVHRCFLVLLQIS